MSKYVKHFFTLFVGVGLSMLISFITVPIITRLVNPTIYGQLSFFNMFSNIAYMLLLLGLDQAYVRFFYKSDTDQYRKSLFYNCLKIPVLLTIVTMIPLIFLSKYFIKDLNCSSEIVTLIFALNVLSLIIQRLVLLTLRLNLETKKYSALTILAKASNVIVTILLIVLLKNNYFLILIFSTFFSAFLTSIIGFLMKRRFYINDLKMEKIDVKSMIKYGVPFIFTSILSMGFQYADKITIKYYGTYNDVGIYSGALNIISAFSIISTIFNTLWVPLAMEHYEKDPEEKSLYITGNEIITAIMFFFSSSLILFKDIIILLLGNNYKPAMYILPFLVFEPVMNTISETTVNGINFFKKSKMHIVITFTCCLVNLIGNMILIPIVGIKGAAISTGLSYILFFAMRTIISNRYYYVPFKLNKVVVLIIVNIIYAFINTFMDNLLLNILIYIINLILILILYKDLIKKGILILKKQIIDMKNKRAKIN